MPPSVALAGRGTRIVPRVLGAEGVPMITPLTGLPDGVLGFEGSGKLTAEDYTAVRGPARAAAAAPGRPSRKVLYFGVT